MPFQHRLGDESEMYKRSGSLIQSFRSAFAGAGFILRTQRNARIHLLATIMVVVLGIWLEIDHHAWAALILVIGLVWIAELFNTAIESCFDRIGLEPHSLAKVGKDLSATAVLISAFAAVIIGLLVLGPPLWNRLFPH